MKYKKEENNYILILEKDEKIIESIQKLAQIEKITSASIAGIGGIKNVNLGFFNGQTYEEKVYLQTYELLNITGNISLFENKSSVHLHAVISDRDFNVFGGHLLEAEISITAEIFIKIFQSDLKRRYNESVNINAIYL